jgi:hypothetical protein
MTSNPPPVALEPELAALDPKAYQILVNVFGAKFAENFQGTFIVMNGHVIHSPTARRFWVKDFAYLSRQMHYEYQYRTWHGFSPEILDRYATIITTKLTNILTAQSNWLLRLQKILDQHGKNRDDAMAMFPRVGQVDVPIIASQARMYLDVLGQLDKVYVLASTTNLWGLLDSTQRAEMEWFCKRAVRAFRVVLQFEVTKLYREAQRVKKDQHSKGENNPQMERLVELQGQDIKQFNAAAEEESRHEGNLGLDQDSDRAGQAIDDAAAAAKAAANASGRKRTAKKADATAPAAPAAADTAAS